MRDIIMSVKARHIRNMQLNHKRYELRKTRPASGETRRVWLCQSGTGGQITAAFTCREWVDLTDVDDMQVARLGCVTAAEVRGYRRERDGRLWGWKIDEFEYFGRDSDRHIQDHGIYRPPQSWCYEREEHLT